MKQIILASGLLTAVIAMPQFVSAEEKTTETSSLNAISQIEQTLPELSDAELAKVEGQAAQVNLGGPGLISVQANVNDTVDINNNDVKVSVVALSGGVLTVQR